MNEDKKTSVSSKVFGVIMTALLAAGLAVFVYVVMNY